jgi:hypothetical protein
MQPARFKLHAEERACSPVRRPSLRGHALTMKTLIMAEGQGEGGTQAVPRVVPAGMKPHRSPSAANSSDRAPTPQAPGPGDKRGGQVEELVSGRASVRRLSLC